MKSPKNLKFGHPSLTCFTIGAFLLLLLPLLLASCTDQRVQTITWNEYEPVYMSQEEFISSVALEGSRDLENPGKIYFYDGYLFVNEVNEGIHILDNRDPSNPVNIGFINIPANKDLAVKGEYLYADSQKDLLVFDISDLQNPEMIDRIEDVFITSSQQPPGFTTQSIDNSRGLVVDWKEVTREEICEDDCRSHPQWGSRITPGGIATSEGIATSFDGAGSRSGDSGGIGGSMARFAITGNYLYAVDFRDLYTFDISEPTASKVNDQYVGWMIETIFPYNNNLFIGSGNSMYIYDLSNPEAPNQLSVFRHATACDPVVVEGDYAFVTLRDGEMCPNNPGNNQLEVIDVSDLTNPEKVGIYEMINPQGLGIDNGNLFISEGEHGLKVMDASDPTDVKMIRHITDIKTYDVIPFNNVLMVTGASGIVQYDYSDINNLEHLSTIPVYENSGEPI